MTLKPDCRHFPGDRPCRFNKESGQTCDGCPHYATAGLRILVIKLAALGDVLRTTVILPGIKSEFPDSTITWLTSSAAADLLAGNPLIDELWTLDTETALRLSVREFDLVLSPDADPEAAILATAVRAKEKRGMVLHPRGYVMPATPEAEGWLEMGAFDQVKKANRRSYQEWIYQTLKLDYRRQELSLALTEGERRRAAAFLARPGSPPEGRLQPPRVVEATMPRPGATAGKPLVGLNLGGGGRWKKKQWKPHHFATFGRELLARGEAGLLLIGGRQEAPLMEALLRELPAGVMATGPDRTLRETAALIGFCSVVVTGDSLALHMASALRVPTVVLVGPTSAAELELYGRGEHLIAPIGCVQCYLTDCDVDPDCMQLIDPANVLAAARKWMFQPPGRPHRPNCDDHN